jgi:diaminopimelate epimerase
LPLADETLSVVLVSMGNPHCVVLVDKLDLAQVHRLGPQIENHSCSPNAPMSSSWKYRSPYAKDWYLGAGRRVHDGLREQQLRAASAMRRLGKVDDRVDVNMPGGQLHITFDADFQVRMQALYKIASLTLDKDCCGGSAIFTGAA